jgi:acyl-CoA synthetase (AMP-forming)/AMP-acid ligase II
LAEVPEVPWSTIPEMMRDVAARYAELDAVVDGETRLDFAGLRRESLRFARSLSAVGIAAGDPVAIWASNGWRWVVAASGAWQVGAAVVPLASRWKAGEVGPLLERVGARILVVDEQSADERLLAALIARYGSSADAGAGGAVLDSRPIAGLSRLERIVVLDSQAEGEADRADRAPRAGVTTWAEFLSAGEGAATPDGSVVRPEAVAEILFTSGTTGAPKGVELCHRQLLSAYWDWSGIGGLRPGDRFLVIPPYSHGFGMNGGVLACWMRGVANVPVAVFDPRSTLEAIGREQISVISGPPTLFATLMNLEGFDPAQTRSLRTAFVGAAAVPTELIQAMRGRMGIERVINAYGLIEVCVVSMTRADDPESVVATTTGRAMPGVEVRIVKTAAGPAGGDEADDASAPVDAAPGEPGEVWVRSQGVMRGYFRDPEQTAATIVEGGWCRTGDVGVRDASGHLRVVDRLKDAYNCGGFSAYPAEIENQLLEYPGVAQVAVVGVADARLGEVGHAFVIARAGSNLDPEALVAWARANMAGYKVPRRVHVLASLPLNANGKVRKDALRAQAIETAEYRT